MGRNRCSMRALDSITSEQTWSGMRPCIVHMCVFRCVVYALMLDEKMDKFDAKDTKCLFMDYYEGIHQLIG